MKPNRTKGNWLSDRFVTLMLVPERTRRVYKVVVPFFAVKITLVFVAIGVFFLICLGVDYVNVLGSMAENKRLKGENFKLQQEVQLVRNKVDTMENSIERVRNYAKKLQILTGETASKADQKAMGQILEGLEKDDDRSPTSILEEKEVKLKPTSSVTPAILEDRLGRLEESSLSTEIVLAKLQDLFLMQTAIAEATPSLFPLVGRISSGFGFRSHPHDGGYKKHLGVDIVADPGTPVRAPASGTVVYSGTKQGYGKVVIIDHGFGIQTVFAHNSRFFVPQGARVKRGEVIAHVGSTGRSTGPHLHYEIRKNGVAVNPHTFISSTRY